MTTDPLTFAQEALGCREFADYDTCIEHGGEGWPCRDALRVADLIKARDRAIRAAALEEAAGECRTERRWQTEREDRRLPPDSVKARMFVVENLLRDRAKRIREGR